MRKRRMNSCVPSVMTLISRAAIGAIILVPEGDAVVVGGDQPAVGDGDAVGIAREISEHRLRVHRTEALRRGTHSILRSGAS